MACGGNPNHPQKGDRITVEPIRELAAVDSIKRLLAGKPRDFCFFVLGINTNLRASDLLGISIGQVRGKKPGEGIFLREKKTGKPRHITINKAVADAVAAYLAARPGDDAERLFRGLRGPLGVPAVSRMVKQWCAAVGLGGNYGAHSLRKTWGYHQRVTFGESVPVLMVVFGHETQAQTLAYLCIQEDEVRRVYGHEL